MTGFLMRQFSGRTIALVIVFFWLGITNHCVVEVALALDNNASDSEDCAFPWHGDRADREDSHSHGSPCDSTLSIPAKSIEALHALADSLDLPLLFVLPSDFINQIDAYREVEAASLYQTHPPKIDAIFFLHSSPNAPPLLLS